MCSSDLWYQTFAYYFVLDTCGFKGRDQYTRWMEDIQYETGKRQALAHGKMQKMAIRVKRTDKLLFPEGITAHFVASLELFEGGDVDFLRTCIIAFCRLISA